MSLKNIRAQEEKKINKIKIDQLISSVSGMEEVAEEQNPLELVNSKS